jgi:hypothetical protein
MIGKEKEEGKKKENRNFNFESLIPRSSINL